MKIQKKTKERLLEDRGVAILTEFIICYPLLMLLLSYIICFSQVFYAKQIALTAADIGARRAITETSGKAARKSSKESSENFVSTAGMGITLKDTELTYSSWTRGEICDYTVTLEIQTMMPMPIRGGFSKEQEVSARSHMMIEREG